MCREAWPAFAAEAKESNRHPEMARGSPSPEILIVSINPKFDPNRIADPDVSSFIERATSPNVLDENPFDQALAKALPAGYGIKYSNVTNTRVYKCATETETKIKGVVSTCADRFLTRELRVMKPCIVLAMGKSAWPATFRLLNAGPYRPDLVRIRPQDQSTDAPSGSLRVGTSPATCRRGLTHTASRFASSLAMHCAGASDESVAS
jgi:hypothetical protein